MEWIERLAGAVLDRAEADADTPMPGYTHLQRAQPVTVGHHLLAWAEMLERDRERFRFAAAQAAPSPLGAGALAGSTLPLPAPPGQMRNSLDAVSDRDFALDYLYACAACHSHLSRIGEEICLWATSEFGFVRLPEAAATGSSMMPQKLNPDVAELARGKAGTALGRLTGLLAVLKGLPLAYDRDLQEDKAPVFAARRDLAGDARRADRARRRSSSSTAAGSRPRPPIRCSSPPTPPRRSSARAIPFRDAHEQVAAEVRDGTFTAPAAAPRPRSRPGRRARRAPRRAGTLVGLAFCFTGRHEDQTDRARGRCGADRGRRRDGVGLDHRHLRHDHQGEDARVAERRLGDPVHEVRRVRDPEARRERRAAARDRPRKARRIQFTFQKETGPAACKGSQAVGRYGWSLKGKTLKLTRFSDKCVGRRTVLGGTFTKVG